MNINRKVKEQLQARMEPKLIIMLICIYMNIDLLFLGIHEFYT
jgi:hypothetical protein